MTLWLVAVGCSSTPGLPDPVDLSAQEKAGPPLLLQVGAMEDGGTVGIRVANAAPNARVLVYAGTKVVNKGPCWSVLQGGCFGIKKPAQIASLTADGTGTVRADLPVVAPLGAVVPLQAVAEASPPLLSNVVSRTVVAAGSSPPPLGGNVLLVVLDDVGVEKLNEYGSKLPAVTPTIDSLAATGMVFDNAYTRPVCVPARASLQTGRMGRRTGVGINWRDDEPYELGTEQLTLAELARMSPYYDYSTSFAGKWHLATAVSPSGFAHPKLQGWQWYAGPFANLYTPSAGYLSYYDWLKVGSDGLQVSDTTYATTDTFDDAIARVGAMSEPWLLMVSTNAAHLPLDEPPPELMPTPVAPDQDGAIAREMIQAVDTELGRLLASVPADVLARTTIVVTADNGTHRAQAQPWVDPNRAKGTLFDGGVRVPLIVTGPPVMVPGSHSAAAVDLVDVFPTLAEWVGVDLADVRSILHPDQPYVIDGQTLTPFLDDPATPSIREYQYSDLFGPPGPGPYTEVDRQTIRDQDYKLIVDHNLGKVMFFEYPKGSEDEGPDLIPCGLTSAQGEAYERLTLALAGLTAGMTWDAAAFERPSGDTGTDPDFPLVRDTAATVCP
jgi:arylsulfatase A-like enzyme